jgi:hypothetical protein
MKIELSSFETNKLIPKIPLKLVGNYNPTEKVKVGLLTSQADRTMKDSFTAQLNENKNNMVVTPLSNTNRYKRSNY